MKILVIGDNCTDIFIYGRCQRLSPEAPIPVFEPSKTITNDGMAGNVVANLRKLGVEKVELICNHEQITKTRYVEEKSNQMLLRVDSNDKVGNTFDIKKIDFDSYDAIVVADYNKGFLTLSDIDEISKRAKLSFIDTKKIIEHNYFQNYTFVKMNEVEWENCVKNGAVYEEWESKLIVTMSERGCMYQQKRYAVNNDIEVRDLSGAGDTFMAALVVKYLDNNNIVESIKYANECATKVVQKRGVVTI